MKWKDGWKNSMISSVDAKEKWPALLLQFLENHVAFQQRGQDQDNFPFAAVESADAIGEPVKVWCKC